MTPESPVPWFFLAISLICAVLTLSALARIPQVRYLHLFYFFSGWLTGELALFHIAWQVIVTLIFLINGALEVWTGWLGLAVMLGSWTGLVRAFRQGDEAGGVFEAALRDGFGSGYREVIVPERRTRMRENVPVGAWIRPFKMKTPGVERIRDISYGDAGERNLLDIYRPTPNPKTPCPTLLQIHGGGWTISNKNQQALPLMHHLAARGWVCVAANYRLSPKARFPDHLVDVKRALAWIKEQGGEYGADPNFVAITGGSAGGHLSSLASLTANQVELQPGFEEADTSVSACVTFYGVYDFLNRHHAKGGMSMAHFLMVNVMPCPPDQDRVLWDLASPITRVNTNAPPFLIIHGTHDSLVPAEGAQHFADSLRAVSNSAVIYVEVPGAQHAFDIFHSVRCEHTINAVARFLEYVYAMSKR